MGQSANSFLEQAEGCRAAAERVNDPKTRAVYLDLAKSWQTLAEYVQQLESQRGQDRAA